LGIFRAGPTLLKRCPLFRLGEYSVEWDFSFYRLRKSRKK
jgi:hypothetical protein